MAQIQILQQRAYSLPEPRPGQIWQVTPINGPCYIGAGPWPRTNDDDAGHIPAGISFTWGKGEIYNPNDDTLLVTTVALSDGSDLVPQIPVSQAEVYTDLSAGAVHTLPDPLAWPYMRLGLDQPGCVLTFPALQPASSFVLELIQTVGAARVVTWPGTVRWEGDIAPLLSVGAGKRDLFSFLCTDGSTWVSTPAGFGFRGL